MPGIVFARAAAGALPGIRFAFVAAGRPCVGLAVGTVLLDLGVQAAQTANVAIVYGLRADARGRMNTVFVSTMFFGGALGAVGAGSAWSMAGWSGVCGFGAALTIVALGLHLSGRRRAEGEMKPVTQG